VRPPGRPRGSATPWVKEAVRRSSDTSIVRDPHMRKIAFVLVALAVALGLLAGPAEGQATSDQDMGRQWAGSYYLRGACTNAHAFNGFNWRVWLGRDTIPLREVQRRLPEIKRLTAGLARAERQWVEHLRQPPAAWPREVRTPVARLALDNSRYASLLDRAARADTGRAWGKWWRVSRGYDFAPAAKKIRERLDLPASRSCIDR
jgi:hypothetical protein